MEDQKSKLLTQATNIFEKLKTNDNSAFFTEKKVTQHLFKKLKESSYSKDKEFVNLIINVENSAEINETDKKIIPLRPDYVEKCDIDGSTLYSIDRIFQLVGADVSNLEFLGKSAFHPKYFLVVVDLFASKIYTYPMRSQWLLAKNLSKFYVEVVQKRNNEKNEIASRSRISTE